MDFSPRHIYHLNGTISLHSTLICNFFYCKRRKIENFQITKGLSWWSTGLLIVAILEDPSNLKPMVSVYLAVNVECTNCPFFTFFYVNGERLSEIINIVDMFHLQNVVRFPKSRRPVPAKKFRFFSLISLQRHSFLVNV